MEYGVFLFFAGFLLIMIAFVYFLLPETKGLPVEKAHAVFRTHPLWSRIYPEVKEVQNVDAGPEADIPEEAIKAGCLQPSYNCSDRPAQGPWHVQPCQESD